MQNKSIKLVAVGDIFLADSPLKTGLGVKSCINKNGKNYYINKIKKILNGSDICFGNIECVLSNKDVNKYNISSVEIRGQSDYADILIESGFNIVNIANNHIFQHGLEPYLDSIDNLVSRGIKVIGDEYYNRNLEIFELNGIIIGFVGYSMHYEQYHPNKKTPYSLKIKSDDILADIKKIKSRFDGILVCSLHWGHEFLDSISLEQRELCHQLVDCGVGIILGHHSHVSQGIESYNGAIIAYSLGNFIFDMDNDLSRKSFVLEINLNCNGITSNKIIPIHIGDDYCPCLMDKEHSDNFILRINELSVDIINGLSLPDDQMKINEQQVSSNIYKHNYMSFFENIFKTNIYYNVQIIIRAILRRIGVVHNP